MSFNERDRDPNIGKPIYVSAIGRTVLQRRQIDVWCYNTFGEFRHDPEVDLGWQMRNEEEYVWFVTRWGGENVKDISGSFIR